jgi:hypothetical protein
MFKPWGIHAIVSHEGEEPYDLTIWAYHLEDLIDQLQEEMSTNATFRLRLLEGSPTLSVEILAKEIGRNYVEGKPQERVDWMEIWIEDGVVVAVCEH